MRKLLILASLVLFVLPVGAKSYYRGDINMNGNIDQEDVTLLADVLIGKREMPQDIALYDVNGDKQITLTDLTVLIETLNGNIPKEIAHDEISTDGSGSFD